MADETQTLLTQLRAISPMPDDDVVTEEIVQQYEEIVFALDKTDPRVIQPLLDSLGYGFGFGLYDMVENTLEKFPFDQLFPALVATVQHGQRGSRLWAVQMLGRSRKQEAIPYVIAALADPEERVREAAVRGLDVQHDPALAERVAQLQHDPSPLVQRAVTATLAAIKSTEG